LLAGNEDESVCSPDNSGVNAAEHRRRCLVEPDPSGWTVLTRFPKPDEGITCGSDRASSAAPWNLAERGSAMTKLEIKGRFDDLVIGIRGDAEKFGLSPAVLADGLRFVAMDYLILEADYAASRTRGEVLNEIAHVAKGDVETISRRSGVLAGEALAAVCGQYPVASIKLNGLDDYRDVFVPGRLDLEVAAFKKMAAVHTRKNAPVLFAAKGVSTGLESARASDPRTSKQTLAAFAREAPELFAEAVGHAEALLKQTLQVGDGAAGRNLRVEDNLKAPAKWQLINLVLDLIWPIEKGAMHSSLMRHARSIVEQVIFYAEGAHDREGGESRLTRDRLTTLGDDEDDSGRVRHYRFDSGWFSSILTYRH
jgi:hypothetical protein